MTPPLLRHTLATLAYRGGKALRARRMAGAPVRGENDFKAAITVGQVGPDQPGSRREFD